MQRLESGGAGTGPADGKRSAVIEILEVFRQAQAAVAAANWQRVFELLDEPAVQAIGKNSLVWLSIQDPALWSHFPGLQPVMVELNRRAERISASARQVLAEPNLERSLAHRDLVKQHDALLKRAVKGRAVALGNIEGLRRSRGEGGSLSSRLFQDERLEDLVVEGARASAVRVDASGFRQRVTFVRRRSGWKIQLAGL